jgi:hypothetical protein
MESEQKAKKTSRDGKAIDQKAKSNNKTQING